MDTDKDRSGSTRRAFLKAAAATTVASGVASGVTSAADTHNGASAGDPSGFEKQEWWKSIRESQLFTESLNEKPHTVGFKEGKGLTGAQVFANLCKQENLGALFCCPGNYQVTHEIAEIGIPTYGGRTEGNMCGAADGFHRASGEVAACSGTEGPGFASMLMQIASAHFSNSALLVLASNRNLEIEDTQTTQQFMLQQEVTSKLRKYGKRITTPDRIYEYGAYAFRNLKSGIPGVVHLDFPDEVTAARFNDSSSLTKFVDKKYYRSETRPAPHAKDLARAVEMIDKAQRPVIVAGHGVIVRKGWEALVRVAEKNDIPVVTTGPVRGAIPDDHRLCANMANSAFEKADLVVFVGLYLAPEPSSYTFAADVPTIRVHPVAEDLGRNWAVDLGLVSDEAYFLEALLGELPAKKRESWVGEIASASKKFDDYVASMYQAGLDQGRKAGALHPSVISQEVHNFLYKGKIDPKQTLTAWGGWHIGRNASLLLRAFRPAQEIQPLYQFGAIGAALPMAIGASAAVQLGAGNQSNYAGAPVVVVTSDSDIGFGLMELDTAVKYKLPVICVVYNNACWSSYTQAKRVAPKATHIHLHQENIRYDIMAQGLGARGELVQTPEALRAALQRAYDAASREKLSTLINCHGLKEFSDPQTHAPVVASFHPAPGIGAWQI